MSKFMNKNTVNWSVLSNLDRIYVCLYVYIDLNKVDEFLKESRKVQIV